MEFIKSLTPQDWVTFVLAALALLVAAGSLVVSILGHVRGRAPVPAWVTSTEITGDTDPDKGRQTRIFSVENRGLGDALDVTIQLISVDGGSDLKGLIFRDNVSTVKFSQSADVRIERFDGKAPEAPIATGMIYGVLKDGARTALDLVELPRRAVVGIYWSEGPRARRRHRKFTIDMPEGV